MQLPFCRPRRFDAERKEMTETYGLIGLGAAGTGLAKEQPNDPPHIILLPEIAFDEAKFLARVKEVVDTTGCCVVVVGEGLKDAEGNEIGADKSRLDAFGHPVLAGAADRLAEIVEPALNLKTRTVKLGYAQRAAAHPSSVRNCRRTIGAVDVVTAPSRRSRGVR